MFRTIWGKTLRDYRYAIAGWGIGLALGMWFTMVYYGTVDEGARVAQAHYAQSFRFLGEPVAADTLVGYTTWHTVGILPIVLSIWTALAGAWLARGEEERGSLDLTLATPHSRIRVLLEKIAAFVTALAVMSLLIAAGTVAGEMGAGIAVDIWGALLVSMNIALAALVFGMLALLLSQVFSRRAPAAGWAGAAVIFAYLLNGTGRMLDHGEWLQRLSPFYYHDLSKPLIASYGVNVGAMLLLVGLCVALGSLSVALFVARDIGAAAVALPALSARLAPRFRRVGGDLARRDIFVRSVGLRALRAEAATVFWWLVALLLYTVWMTLLAQTMKEAIYKIIQGSPELAAILSGFDVLSDNGFVAALVFFYMPVLLALFAMMLAMAWSHDLESGRVELGLSAPLPRWRVYLERFGAILAPMLLAPALTGLSILISARIAGLSVAAERIPAAALGMLAMEVIVAAVVYSLAGWLRSAAIVGVIGAVIGVSFFAELLNPLLKLPEWAISLSLFHHFGSPLTQSPYWGDWLALLALAVVILAIGALRFTRGDVRSGS